MEKQNEKRSSDMRRMQPSYRDCGGDRIRRCTVECKFNPIVRVRDMHRLEGMMDGNAEEYVIVVKGDYRDEYSGPLP